MAARDHTYHHDHHDERVRVNALKRHEDRVRLIERGMERQRITRDFSQNTRPVEDPTGFCPGAWI